MPSYQPTTWPLSPHTAAKHFIFRRHLSAWLPKLAWAGNLLIIDGFAGPGEYTGGEPGSPIIAVDTAVSHRANLAGCRIQFLFIEEDGRRFSHLEEKVSELPHPSNIAIETRHASFKEVVGDLLDAAEGRRQNLHPSFFMIDPFGFEGVPMSLVERISRQPRSEVLISFMYDSVTRWLGDPRNELNFDELFGTRAWRDARNMADADIRRQYLLDLYVEQLRKNGWRYVRTFEMKDKGNRTEYFLVFGTNHLDGLRVMKDAMWKVDPSGQFMFSDATDRRQLTLIAPEPDFGQLKRLIWEHFSERAEFTIEELEEFVLVDTAFRETHYKNQILRPAEKAGQLEVVGGGTRTGRSGYPDGTVLRLVR
jgi:three-Cys-motif partner protein